MRSLEELIYAASCNIGHFKMTVEEVALVISSGCPNMSAEQFGTCLEAAKAGRGQFRGRVVTVVDEV